MAKYDYTEENRWTEQVRFENETYRCRLEKARTPDDIKTQSSELIGRTLKVLPPELRVTLARWATHARNVFRIDVGLHLVK
jgi:hypothetical protein